jgi:hypothetical protein
MTEKEKSIFELMSKFMKSRGCEFAEIDLDADSYEPYNNRDFGCGTGHHIERRDKFPFGIGGFIKDFVNSNQDYGIDDENLVELQLRVHGQERRVTLDAVYSELVEGPSESTERSVEEGDENLKKLIDKWESNGLYPFGEVTFNGGGDSGYIDNDVQVYTGDIVSRPLGDFPGLDDYLYDMLSSYGGWEINEGSQGYFRIDTRAGTVELFFTWNEYKNENVRIGAWEF